MQTAPPAPLLQDLVSPQDFSTPQEIGSIFPGGILYPLETQICHQESPPPPPSEISARFVMGNPIAKS